MAWDVLFGRRKSCFIRVRTKSGLWVGGWYGRRSSASAYPHEPDLYLQTQYRMNPDGTFAQRMVGTGGIYLRGADIDILEILEPADMQLERTRDERRAP